MTAQWPSHDPSGDLAIVHGVVRCCCRYTEGPVTIRDEHLLRLTSLSKTDFQRFLQSQSNERGSRSCSELIDGLSFILRRTVIYPPSYIADDPATAAIEHTLTPGPPAPPEQRSAWVKSCREDCPTASVLPKPKQQLCIQSGTRAHYLNYLHRWARRGKEAQAIGLAIR